MLNEYVNLLEQPKREKRRDWIAVKRLKLDWIIPEQAAALGLWGLPHKLVAKMTYTVCHKQET